MDFSASTFLVEKCMRAKMVLSHFLAHIKQGQMGYYLPDEDFGAEQSVFVDFFATYKATLPGLNKNGKISESGGYSNVPTL